MDLRRKRKDVIVLPLRPRVVHPADFLRVQRETRGQTAPSPRPSLSGLHNDAPRCFGEGQAKCTGASHRLQPLGFAGLGEQSTRSWECSRTRRGRAENCSLTWCQQTTTELLGSGVWGGGIYSASDLSVWRSKARPSIHVDRNGKAVHVAREGAHAELVLALAARGDEHVPPRAVRAVNTERAIQLRPAAPGLPDRGLERHPPGAHWGEPWGPGVATQSRLLLLTWGVRCALGACPQANPMAGGFGPGTGRPSHSSFENGHFRPRRRGVCCSDGIG